MSDSTRQLPGDNSDGIRRRDFIALGTAAAAVVTAGSAARGAVFAERSPLGVDLLKGGSISVGYIAGSDAWVQALDLPWDNPNLDTASFELDIVPADSLTVGSDLALATIELSVHGFFPRLPRAGAVSWRSCYLFASVPAPPELIFGPDPLPFLAWSARTDPQPSQAAKVRPVLSTGVDGALRLGIELRSGKTAPSGGPTSLTRPAAVPAVLERSTNFTVDDIQGRPKLQEGVYLLALTKGLWDGAWRGSLDSLRSVDGLESIAIGIRRLE